MGNNATVAVLNVADLQNGDALPAGTLLGLVTTADVLIVKSVVDAANGHVALTLYRVGTLFVQGKTLVEVIDA